MQNDLNNKWNHFRLVVQKSLEDSLSPEEIHFLRESLLVSAEARRYYIDYVTVHGSLFLISGEISNEKNDQGVTAINKALMDLSKYEKIAPATEITLKKPQGELLQHVEVPVTGYKQKLSKWNLISLTATAAAVVFFVLFVHFVPQKEIEVATLTDSINARWADTDTSMSKGTRFETNGDKYFLREGLTQLTFDNEAKVTFEGPVEFQILTEDQIKLYCGRLYATVPQGAIGFTVNTLCARIIDLGTEFGIEAAASGDTYLHVMKGRTTLIAGEKSDKVSMEVGKGVAKKVSALTSVISDITCNEELFVRAFNSKENIVWKGQKTLDLADIAGGGNGLGTGKTDMGIDPVTGNFSTILTYNQASTNEYHPVPSNPYIDGVFIPNGKTKQIISSQGHIFQECPVSSGYWYLSIINTVRILDLQAMQFEVNSNSSNAQCLLMHANMGITYDLQAMRSLFPHVKIVRFQSKFGIGKEMERPCNADFWILVDGKLKYQKTQVKEKKLFSVDIELTENDRFLTLITTDGQDPEGQDLAAIDSDWCMFADPVLVLE
jgi:hypothetical protein